ncbi:GNAT family protein [Nocardioides sp. 616]|uniref:GNAT family N-acetyltransferase n=1 Tax=Nocardioides sp. 616 TaxID=2268090 RepID=UPI000CE3DE33|nr:GNAT family protein [Nocardioides sp. 616]
MTEQQELVVRALLRERLLDQAHQGALRLEADRRDNVARGLLGEAAAKLLDPPSWVTEARDRLLLPLPPELPLRTERLVLRRVQLDDVDDLHSYYGRADVSELLLSEPMSRDKTAVEIRRRLGMDGDDPEPPQGLGLAMELAGRVVGDVVLMFKAPEYAQAELGWVVHPDVAGQGLATEAARAMLQLGFGHYGFMRLTAELDARNERSAALCERLGMRREGYFRQDYWSKGRWTDTLRYALLAEEFFAGGAV